MIGELQHYAGREQAYVKHFLLSDYLETFAHKIASGFAEICYVDGFSGPWQNTGERFEDTSFGIALGALTRAKATWRALGREVRMSAHLIEKDGRAYRNLQAVKAQFPEIEIATHHGSFIDLAPDLRNAISAHAFAFIFIDPKGWRIDMKCLAPLLSRPNSEVVFNFMFDFINRAASIQAPEVKRGLHELIPTSAWRDQLALPPPPGLAEAEYRKRVLVEAFSSELGCLGDYRFVAETTVLRPTRDRPLYCLVYATRSPIGLKVFRESQIKALRQQDMIRGRTKLTTSAANTGQNELFGSISEMAPDPATAFFDAELEQAEQLMKAVTPCAPDGAPWGRIWPQVMERYVVSHAQLNQLAGNLHRQGIFCCADWGHRKRVPDDGYRLQRPQA